MTLFQETTAAGERGAGAPGGAQRHLPPPAAPAALAPPRERPRRHQCAVCGRRGTKERLFGPQLGWGDSLPSESLPLRGLPSDRCSALPRCNRARPGAARVAPPGGRGTQSGPWFPRILGLRPRLKTLKCPIGLWRPAGLPRRRQDPGTTAPHLPVCGLQGDQCAPLGTNPPGRLQDKRGAAALKLSPCHAKHLRAKLWLG